MNLRIRCIRCKAVCVVDADAPPGGIGPLSGGLIFELPEDWRRVRRKNTAPPFDTQQAAVCGECVAELEGVSP